MSKKAVKSRDVRLFFTEIYEKKFVKMSQKYKLKSVSYKTRKCFTNRRLTVIIKEKKATDISFLRFYDSVSNSK